MEQHLLVKIDKYLSEELKLSLNTFKNTYAKLEPHVLIDGIPGSSMLMEFDDISDWLLFQKKLKSADTTPDGYVPSITYLYTNTITTKIIGIINIRLTLNEYLNDFGGHIGYAIHPNERNQGHGAEMLFKIIKQSKQLGLNRVLLTCKHNNIGSKNIILKHGGQLENTVINNKNEMIERYWINI